MKALVARQERAPLYEILNMSLYGWIKGENLNIFSRWSPKGSWRQRKREKGSIERFGWWVPLHQIFENSTLKTVQYTYIVEVKIHLFLHIFFFLLFSYFFSFFSFFPLSFYLFLPRGCAHCPPCRHSCNSSTDIQQRSLEIITFFVSILTRIVSCM